MITLSILNHCDPDFVGDWKWNKNFVELGPQGDLWIQDNHEWGIISFHESKLTFYPNEKIESYLYNKKKSQGERILKTGDLLKIKDLEIKIGDFELHQEISRIEKLKERFQEVKNQNPELYQLLAKLKELS